MRTSVVSGGGRVVFKIIYGAARLRQLAHLLTSKIIKTKSK